MLTRRIALFLLVTAACTDAPAAVKLELGPELGEVLADMVAAGEISQTRARIVLTALQLEPGQVLMVRDVGDEPENVIRSLGVVEGDGDDPPVELYLATRPPGS